MSVQIFYERDRRGADWVETDRNTDIDYDKATSKEWQRIAKAMGGKEISRSATVHESVSPDGLSRSMFYRFDSKAPAVGEVAR
jgi:hypothetical protein